MKDINEVMRQKELEVQRLQREIEALRVAARILADESEAGYAHSAVSTPAATFTPPTRSVAASPASGEAGYNSSWEAASKKFP